MPKAMRPRPGPKAGPKTRRPGLPPDVVSELRHMSRTGKADMAIARLERAVALLDRPRAVLTIPRWRGGLVRAFDAFPGLATRLLPLWMRDAQRRQRRWKKRIERDGGP